MKEVNSFEKKRVKKIKIKRKELSMTCELWHLYLSLLKQTVEKENYILGFQFNLCSLPLIKQESRNITFPCNTYLASTVL